MKTKTNPVYIGVASLATLAAALSGCSREKSATPAPPRVTQTAPAPTPSEPAQMLKKAQVATSNAMADAGNALAASWENIKDYTYEKRADFSAGFGRMASSLDEQVQALKAKRATVPEASVKDWDFNMKELEDARADLRSKLSELGKASSETWALAKERAAEAWKRAQEAAAKVKSSTTS